MDKFVDARIIRFQIERLANVKEASPRSVLVPSYKDGHGSYMQRTARRRVVLGDRLLRDASSRAVSTVYNGPFHNSAVGHNRVNCSISSPVLPFDCSFDWSYKGIYQSLLGGAHWTVRGLDRQVLDEAKPINRYYGLRRVNKARYGSKLRRRGARAISY